MFYCAKADWDVSYKTLKPLLFAFEIHTSLENSVLYIPFFFNCAFTLTFIPMNCLEPYLQNTVSETQTSLFCFREGLQSRHTHVVSSSKSSCFYDFTKPSHFC